MDRYHGLPVNGADLVWALGSIAGLHRKPFDAQLLLQQFPPPYSVASLISAAQALGFDARFGPDKLDRVNRADLPCLAVLVADTDAEKTDLAENNRSTGTAPTEQPALNEDASELAATETSAAQPDAGTADATSRGELLLITALDADRVQYFSRTTQTARTVARSEFEPRFTGEVIQFTLNTFLSMQISWSDSSSRDGFFRPSLRGV